MILNQNREKLTKVQVAGIVLRPNSPEIKDVYLQIKSYFEYEGIEVLLELTSAKMINESGFDLQEICERCDFIVSCCSIS
jgi:NAD+ kinase